MNLATRTGGKNVVQSGECPDNGHAKVAHQCIPNPAAGGGWNEGRPARKLIHSQQNVIARMQSCLYY
ncbi:hypothetical protein Pint_10539 [Pistacia integerrima]|uniref:Uncharacterized protein n=1 Tax=Pistacia integerrima TaxID=434235 RepID=A0ACC0XKJ5_9ROSI|nr:hypothetical protein Pint_10539 [Pistacia integerrima]